jgi:hypothetical protein
MFNTTTEPTPIPTSMVAAFFNILSILGMSLLIGGSMTELFLYRLSEIDRRKEEETDETETEEEEEDYSTKYTKAFEALALRELSDEEIQQLNTKMVREEVAPNVEVILTFDKETDTFWYYTDKLKDVSYAMLETVARKFAIDYDCKIIFQEDVFYDEEEKAEEQAQKEQAQKEQAQKEPAQKEQAQAPSVFAKFKNYNTGKGAAPNFTSVIKVTEQMNHFRYRGKLVDYAKPTPTQEEAKTMDYASYKKLMDEKKTL